MLQSLLITLFGDKNSCLEIRVMCCFSKPVEEGVGRHGFAALFTSPRRPASPAALPVSPPRRVLGHPPCQLGPPQALGIPPRALGWLGAPRHSSTQEEWEFGGHPHCAQQPRCPVQPGRSPPVGLGALIPCQGAERAPPSFAVSHGSGARGIVTRWPIPCPCPGWASGSAARAPCCMAALANRLCPCARAGRLAPAP